MVEKIRKKIFLNEKKTKWCQCIVFKNLIDMQTWYAINRPTEKNQFRCLGASIHYNKTCGRKLSGETSTIIISYENCGAIVAGHEFMHSVLWAYKHKRGKKQYPLTITSMKEEEIILHSFSDALVQFYKWYWKKVEPKFSAKGGA